MTQATRATLVRAATAELIATPSVTSTLGSGGAWPAPWIFRWSKYVDISGTGKACAVLSINGSWATPNHHNTAAFPRLQVEVLADTGRGPDLLPTQWTAEETAEAALIAIDKVLHRPAGEIAWGGLTVVSSTRDSEASPAKLPGEDGPVTATYTYAIAL